jgi:hypothetical protein
VPLEVLDRIGDGQLSVWAGIVVVGLAHADEIPPGQPVDEVRGSVEVRYSCQRERVVATWSWGSRDPLRTDCSRVAITCWGTCR